MRFRRVILVAAAIFSFNATPGLAADREGAANVQLVKDFLRDIRATMASRDPAKARTVVEQYMDADYIQHSPGMEPGREGYLKTMTMALSGVRPPGAPAIGNPPGGPPPGGPPGALPGGPPPGGPPGGVMSPPKDLYFVGDGEIVVWVSEGLEAGKLDFNMVRVVNGKMKEHWDSR